MPLIGSFIQQAALYDAQWGEGSYKVEWDIRINSNWNHKKSYLLKMLVCILKVQLSNVTS